MSDNAEVTIDLVSSEDEEEKKPAAKPTLLTVVDINDDNDDDDEDGDPQKLVAWSPFATAGDIDNDDDCCCKENGKDHKAKETASNCGGKQMKKFLKQYEMAKALYVDGHLTKLDSTGRTYQWLNKMKSKVSEYEECKNKSSFQSGVVTETQIS